MNKTFNSYYAAALVPLLVLGFISEHAFAKGGYGDPVDPFCKLYDGSTPFADQGCQLCHTSGYGSKWPEYQYYYDKNYAPFCTGTPPPQPNQAPNGTITSPTGSRTITAGQSLEFRGTGSDPDGDTLSYSWSFAGAAGNLTGAGPHTVTFSTPGSFSVRLTVSDGELSDQTPATRTITVNPKVVCSDEDRDGFAIEGGSCGAVDCDDFDSDVNPNAAEICSDGIDNNCNNLIDRTDPLAINCGGGCPDADGDMFSPTGGICGPIDCDDADREVNPGMNESCGDGLDNDCDQLVDGADAECNGSDCIGELLNGGGPSFSLQLSLNPDRDLSAALDGALVSDNIYVFIPSEPGIVQVRYYLNDQLRQTENYAPWDFAGGNASTANPFDTIELGNGWHEILAEIDLDTGETMAAVASFEVGNGAELTIDISEASWDAGDRELEVEGTWPTNGALVTVSNADTGDVLGSTRVEYDDGELGWEFERERLSVVPCRVLVEIEGEFGEADVANAPSDCDGGDSGGGNPPPANRSPIADDDSATVNEDGSVTINVLANDSDPDGDSIRLASVTQGASGSVQISGSAVVYRPKSNIAGTDSFTYSVEDGQGGAASARVAVTIRPVNDAPVAADDSGATDAGVAVTIKVLANDSDIDGDSLQVSGVGQASNGSVSNNGASVTYTPRSGFDGSDSFTYTVIDGKGGSDTARVTVTVRPITPIPSIQVEIDKAKWNRWRRILEVEGEDAPRDARVTVLNANTGQQLGTTTVESDGEWEVDVRRPSVVPCRVRVEIRKGDAFGSAERNVSRAPTNCL